MRSIAVLFVVSVILWFRHHTSDKFQEAISWSITWRFVLHCLPLKYVVSDHFRGSNAPVNQINWDCVFILIKFAHGTDVWNSLSSACTSMWSLWKLFHPVKGTRSRSAHARLPDWNLKKSAWLFQVAFTNSKWRRLAEDSDMAVNASTQGGNVRSMTEGNTRKRGWETTSKIWCRLWVFQWQRTCDSFIVSRTSSKVRLTFISVWFISLGKLYFTLSNCCFFL